MKKAIIILRNLQESEAENVKAQIRSDSVSVYVHAGLPGLLERFGYADPETIDLKLSEKKRLNYEVLERLLQLGDKEIEHVPVSDHLAFTEFASIWYYHKFRIYFALRNKLYDKALIENYIDDETEYTVYADADLKHYFGSNIAFITPSKNHKINKQSFLRYALFFGLRIIAGMIRGKTRGKYLVIDKGNQQPVLMPDMTTRPGNYIMEYFLKNLDGKYTILHEVEIPKFTIGTPFKFPHKWLKGRNKNTGLFYGETVLLRGLFSQKLISLHKQTIKKLAEQYDILLEHLQDPFERDVIMSFKSLHKTSKYYVFKYLCYDKYFRKQKIEALISLDENSPSVKTIFDAAKANRVRTVGIQHGNIHDLHPAYRFTEKDIKRNVVPDYTLIWGPYWGNLLRDIGNYPPDRLVLTGQLRTDIIPLIVKSDQPVFDDRKINIVFASQPQRDPKIRRQAAYDVFNAIRNLGDEYFLHLKLHPRENADKPYYEAIAGEAGCTNFDFAGDVDLYRIIASCQVLITCFSTVGTETVYFYKPLIILDHLKQDIQNYHKEGVALQVTNSTELTACIRKLAQTNFEVDREAYAKFIGKYAYRIDGKACERARQFIEQDQD